MCGLYLVLSTFLRVSFSSSRLASLSFFLQQDTLNVCMGFYCFHNMVCLILLSNTSEAIGEWYYPTTLLKLLLS